MLAVLAVGIVVFGTALTNVPIERVDVYFLLLFCFTVGLGSRVTVPIPQLKSHIAVSDIFIFLALMLFGGPLAVVLSAVEAFLSSWRFCNKKITVFFNASSAAISTASVTLVLSAFGMYADDRFNLYPSQIQNFLISLSIMALTYFLVNTLLAAVYDALTERQNVWFIWKRKYLWAFVTFFMGAAGAGLLVQLSERSGFFVIVAALPIILLVYASYRMYLTTVRLSIEQAEQAEEYANRIEAQSAALRESEERFRSAFTHAPIGIALVSFEGRWLKVNRALCEMLGYGESELLRLGLSSVTHSEDLLPALSAIQKIVGGVSSDCQLEVRFINRSQNTVWTSLNVSATDDVRAEKCDLVLQILDITDRKLAAEKLEHEASHDALTGLPNRAHFMRRLDEALAKVRQNPKYRVSVLFIDLDRFKYVNDSLGHFIGDELLCSIANRLGATMRPPDMVARLGGDEFVVLVEGRYYSEKVTRIAERIQKKISSPFKLQGHEVFTTASIGILNVSEHHRTSEDVIRDADTAMYQAKRSGKARHETFDDTMREAVRETLQLETDLRRAIQNGELRVHYQPIFSLSDHRLYALEALARWEHPKFGTISPDRFVPLAEEIGLMDELGDYVMHTACSKIGELEMQNPTLRNVKLSINISSKQFADEAIVGRTQAILDTTGFSPGRLKLEITETVFFEDHERALDVLRKLRETGIEVDIDDFGTGYSNLAYLVRLPISTLKIDKSFVMLMAENPANREVIRTIILLASNLGFKVVAEGVESEHQRDVLLDLGCDYGQGYFFSRPLSPDLIETFIGDCGDKHYVPLPAPNVPEASMIQ
jgi:diguanylate cyclase (GGDEF)-like protein/PAS domain S-box-containing protein